jgi:hypothetical protein
VDLVTISQIANPILQTVFIAVIGLGYYFTVRATWATVQEMRAEHAAGGGRPLITVSEDYANLPNISLIVQNVGQGPAKDISFEFSEPVESSDGLILSDLPFFEEGLTSLAPGAKIGCYRGLYDLWTACGVSEGESVLLAATPLDRQFTLTSRITTIGKTGERVRDRILESLRVSEGVLP